MLPWAMANLPTRELPAVRFLVAQVSFGQPRSRPGPFFTNPTKKKYFISWYSSYFGKDRRDRH